MLVRFIKVSFRRWRYRRRRRAAISELRAVDDRTLKDMGLTRGEIVAAVDGGLYRGEPVRRSEPERPEPPAATIDPVELERHLARARQVRDAYLADICARALRGMASALGCFISVLRRRKRPCPADGGKPRMTIGRARLRETAP